jgi:hypothetical protein
MTGTVESLFFDDNLINKGIPMSDLVSSGGIWLSISGYFQTKTGVRH